MSRFEGFVCDVCAEVWNKDSKIIQEVKFTGPTALGVYRRDVCPQCATPDLVAGFKERPKRNRTAGAT